MAQLVVGWSCVSNNTCPSPGLDMVIMARLSEPDKIKSRQWRDALIKYLYLILIL